MKQQAGPFRLLTVLFPMMYSASPALLLVMIGLGILFGVSMAAQTWAFQLFFDEMNLAVSIGAGAITSALWMGALLGAVFIGTEVLNGTFNFLAKVFIDKATGSLSARIHNKASRIDPVAYESTELLDQINKAKEGMNNSFILISVSVGLLCFYTPYFLFLGIYLYTLEPVLAFSLVLIFVPVVFNQYLRSRVFTRLEDHSAPLRREFEYYESCIGDRIYFKETRLLGAVHFFKDLYLSALSLFGKKKWEAEFRTGMMELAMKLITLAGYMGVLYLLFTSLMGGVITIGAFAAVLASIGVMFTVMQEIVSQHFGSLSRNIGSIRNFIRFFDLPERGGEDREIDPGRGIVADQVSFRYPGAERNALSDISLTIRKGETIAIVGENGAGKSTLVQVLTGLYLPTEGDVALDGVSTKEISPSSIYRGMSAVFQDYQRYQMTLADNIRISGSGEDGAGKPSGSTASNSSGASEVAAAGGEDGAGEASGATVSNSRGANEVAAAGGEDGAGKASGATASNGHGANEVAAAGGEDGEARLRQAAAQAELTLEKGPFPQGLDTMLSREFDGIDLSGGQWQRVAIARGLYRNHSLIVLDEPTAAIDPLEEYRIYQQFAEIAKGQTAILVTHRLGSAKMADRIIVMDQGRIVESGSHDELIARKGTYAAMFKAQAQWYAVS
ncbi:ABC transporter ATP-binding protein [Paenibacillus senegalensis]|uniref:ABC transporter ATP-binding protein n=1 Tax=Paenibacillus senegalensis TaxID=1465766 RepID=UPI00028985A3|nr:ABC transporter ATP-binding protein [Paenibacillus senegalensis]